MQQRHWYNDREIFLHGLARSNYVTAITDWFMGFAGKWAELVLYGTVLYSCAELYPGVYLPAGLSLAVFLVQLGALDIGGLSLAKLAKQAREDGNAAGATNAERLSKWLIGIMLVGVVTVGLEHALPVTLPSWIITSVNVLLVVARSICAVLYGRVVHDLKTDSTSQQTGELTIELTSQIHEKLSSELTAAIEQVKQEVECKLSELTTALRNELTPLLEQDRSDRLHLAALNETLITHEHTLAGLVSLPGTIERYERTMKTALQEMRESIEAIEVHRPKLSLVSPVNTEKLTFGPGELTNKEFIEDYFSKYPEAKNVDAIVEASKLGLTISQSQVSQIRKALKEQSA